MVGNIVLSRYERHESRNSLGRGLAPVEPREVPQLVQHGVGLGEGGYRRNRSVSDRTQPGREKRHDCVPFFAERLDLPRVLSVAVDRAEYPPGVEPSAEIVG